LDTDVDAGGSPVRVQVTYSADVYELGELAPVLLVMMQDVLYAHEFFLPLRMRIKQTGWKGIRRPFTDGITGPLGS
jgi:hypothetical protein